MEQATTTTPPPAGAARYGTYGEALCALREAQKSARGVSLYSRYVNRPAGRVLAAAAYRAGLSPNQVTLLSAVCSFAGIAAVAVWPPSWPLACAVYAALVVGFALDAADGQLARLRGGGSAAGEWLDHVVDCAKITALHAAVLISFSRFFELPGPGWLLLPLAFQFTAVVIFFGGLLREKLAPARGHRLNLKAAPAPEPTPAPEPGPAPAPEPGPAPAPGPAPSAVRAVALLPVDYGVFCGVFLLLGGETVFRTGYAVFFAAHALFLAAFSVKWFRELAAAPQSAG